MFNNDILNKLFADYDEIESAINDAESGDIDESIKIYIDMLHMYPEYALKKNNKELLLKSYNFIDFNITNYLKEPGKNKLSEDFIKNSLIYKRKISEALMR